MKNNILWISALLFFAISCHENPYVQGQRIYTAKCASCHMADGTGLESLIPPLANADYLHTHQDKLPCIIKHGLRDTIMVNGVSFSTPMEAVDLSDVEITNVLNYINNAWENRIGETSLKDVKQQLQDCKKISTED